ncbi:MAG: Fe-S cluster assembly protein SufD [Chloroflexi bacterium]|nr:Fe-S cluster assembly protein SufD [Chloroflexota bacterium]
MALDVVTQQQERYLLAFETFARNGAAREPAWAQVLRREAIARFAALGFPVARRGNEEWKYTDVNSLARYPFQDLVLPAAPVPVTAKELAPFTLGEPGWHRLVFVDGSYVPELSLLPSGVTAANLTEAMVNKTEPVQQHLARHAGYSDQAFTALNTAFFHDGAFVSIPDEAVVKGPLHLLFLFTARAREGVFHPRVLVHTGRHSKATIVESYAALAEGCYFTNAVTEVVVGEGASLEHYTFQRQSEQAFHVATTQVEPGRDSTFFSFHLDLGGRLVRNNLNVVTGGEGCSFTLNGLYLPGGSQHVDNQVIIEHTRSHTTAREVYKGVLNHKARSVFHGSIIVREGVKKVNAEQVDKNLLLSDQAEADTKPAFWIYADDVKCGHGAACGQIDQNALFYLRSRGLTEREARQFLVRGFAGEVVASIRAEPIRAHVDELVQARLRGWLEEDETA